MSENLFKKSAILLKNNIMVIQPLFFGVLVLFLVVMPLFAGRIFNLGFIFSLVVSVLCLTAFLAGWYNCVKFTVSLKNNKYESLELKNHAQIEILKQFFPGVGEYMLPVTLGAVLYFILAYGVFELYAMFAKEFYFAKNLPAAFLEVIDRGSQNEIAQYIQSNFNMEQLQVLLLLIVGGFIVYFLFQTFILWFAPAILYTAKNPFRALFAAVKFTFRHFGISALIIFVMFSLNLLISFTNVLLNNQFLAFIPMLLTFIYIMYYVMTVFLYYETESNSIGGAECNG